MKKKILALVLAFTMLVCFAPSTLAYSVRDAYNDFAAQYPEFIDIIVAEGVSESTIIDFLRALQRNLYITNRFTPVTESNFEEVLIEAVMDVSNAAQFSDLQGALWGAYGDAVLDAVATHKVPDELMPLYETVKSMVFDYDMLSSLEDDTNTEDITIVRFSAVEDITVTVGGSYTLPTETGAITETSVLVRVGINWTVEPATDTEGTFTAEGVIEVPDGYVLDDGISDIITAQVIVTSAPVEEKPGESTSGGGSVTRYPDRNNPGEDIVVPELEKPRHIYNFSDVVENSELGIAVYALSDIGIINGYADGTFKPNEKIRRDEFAKIMVTAMENLDIDAAANFTDVPKDHWAYLYIASAQKAGLINGYVDGTFGPDRNISRAEVMTIIYRAVESKKAFKDNTTPVSTFSDDALIADYAREAIYTLARNNIVRGTVSDKDGAVTTKINPLGDATRGQCVIMVYNALRMMGVIK